MSTFAANYAVWTGLVAVVFEYYKRRGNVKISTLVGKGLIAKGGVNLVSTYLQTLDIPLLGNDLDANYIYNGIIGAISEMVIGRGGALTGAEEQIVCSLIGYRFASYWAGAFDVVTSKLTGLNSMFQGSSGYRNADIQNQGTPIPSTNSGSNYTNTTNTTVGGNSTAI